jgi:tRNA dimethylallyltransferase
MIAVVGPTASGKTALSIDIAKRFHGEIISADSRQVYRGMDIGTGKITKREMLGIPHYLLDVASPRRTFTAAHYQRLGKTAIKAIIAKKKLPIVVGGTGLYIDALLHGYALPDVAPNRELRRKLEKRTAGNLFFELKRRDPRRADTIDRHNKRRLIRALEVVLATRRPVPSRGEALARNNNYDVLKIGIAVAPDKLKKNISARLARRLRGGMVKEIERLHENGSSWKRLDSFGLEYRFVSRYLRGMITKQEMIALIEKESWFYAKRQMTWFKRDETIHWIKTPKNAAALVKKFMQTKKEAIRK